MMSSGYTERPQVAQPVVGGIAVEMASRKHDARGAEPGRLYQVGPARWPATAILPGCGGLVEPRAVRQAAQSG